MYEMITQCKHDILKAIHDYEAHFDDTNPMSLTRAQDIIDIKGLLNQTYTHMDDCTQTLKQRLQIFKTGWWIFTTGNSRLRNAIQDVLDDYAKPTMQLVFSKLQILENQSVTIKGRDVGQQGKGARLTDACLSSLLLEKDKLIQYLQADIKRLQHALLQATTRCQQQAIALKSLDISQGEGMMFVHQHNRPNNQVTRADISKESCLMKK